MPDRALVMLELRGAASVRTAVRLLALGTLAPLASLWPHIGWPFAPAFAACFLALEPVYNNALELWPGQLTSYALLPLRWETVFRAKLLATTLLSSGVAAALIVLTSYVQPAPPSADDLVTCALVFLSVHFPLFWTGMHLSRQQARKQAGFGFDDVAAGAIMLVLLGVVSVPALIAGAVPGGAVALLIYTSAVALALWFVLIPSAARRIHEEIPSLWHSTRTSS